MYAKIIVSSLLCASLVWAAPTESNLGQEPIETSTKSPVPVSPLAISSDPDINVPSALVPNVQLDAKSNQNSPTEPRVPSLNELYGWLCFTYTRVISEYLANLPKFPTHLIPESIQNLDLNELIKQITALKQKKVPTPKPLLPEAHMVLVPSNQPKPSAAAVVQNQPQVAFLLPSNNEPKPINPQGGSSLINSQGSPTASTLPSAHGNQNPGIVYSQGNSYYPNNQNFQFPGNRNPQTPIYQFQKNENPSSMYQYDPYSSQVQPRLNAQYYSQGNGGFGGYQNFRY